jgi:hypothetical protein
MQNLITRKLNVFIGMSLQESWRSETQFLKQNITFILHTVWFWNNSSRHS